ncbi:MAG TPA: O-antigen ligase family protein [Nocardioides sp.]|jgi:O-antigen ligase|uniref:O-antigen ligase family protein n=1 Tax=Nocardioides sp. TaxID=35761 RepID=UPI002E35CF27|nr:O-antigen ligase family protein [Nocardioides sp.]HEX3932291.1 O-antigen ligase family protein [Nocardioides sp.]
MTFTGIPPLYGRDTPADPPAEQAGPRSDDGPDLGDLGDLRLQAGITLRFLGRLVVQAAVLGLVLGRVHSVLLAAMVAVLIGLALVVRFPSPGSVAYLGAFAAVTPDTITVLHIGGTPITARTVVFALFSGLTLVSVLRGTMRLRVPTPLLLAGLAMAAVIGTAENGRTKSLLEFVILMLLPPIAGATLATDRRLAVELLRGLTAGTFLVIAFAIFEGIQNHDYLISAANVGTFVRAGHVRTTAGWDYPTTLSAFLCLAGFFVAHLLRTRWGFLGLALGGALVTGAVITTQARSGLLGLAAGVLAYLLLQRKASQAIGALSGLGGIVALVLVFPGAAPGSFRTFLSQSLTSGSAANSNVVYRQDLYTDAHAAVAVHPWFGWGYGSGNSVATNELGKYFGQLTDLASLPVSLAVQLGLVGTACVFLFLLVVVIRTIRARHLPERLPLATGLIASFVAMIGVPVTPPLTWMLLLAGVAWTLTGRPPQRSADVMEAEDPEPAADAEFDTPPWAAFRQAG